MRDETVTGTIAISNGLRDGHAERIALLIKGRYARHVRHVNRKKHGGACFQSTGNRVDFQQSQQ